MPTPDGPTSGTEEMGAESNGSRENTAAGDATPLHEPPRWTEEDWRQWNAGTWSWTRGQDGTSFGGAAHVPPGGGHSGNEDETYPTRRSSTTKSDPWSQPWKDPWAVSQHGSHREESIDERGSGGSDKIVVPEFSAEEDRHGTKARSCLRKIEAWRRVTHLKANKQALVLYNNLTGKAWRDGEDLDLTPSTTPTAWSAMWLGSLSATWTRRW